MPQTWSDAVFRALGKNIKRAMGSFEGQKEIAGWHEAKHV